MCMKLKNPNYAFLAAACVVMLSSCGKKGGGSLPNDGQVHGVSPGNRYSPPKPLGMVYVPQGTFHMGPSDEDPAYAFSARSRSVSISGFWMDATETTNNEYRQFVYWVRDSVAARRLNKVKTGADGNEYVDWPAMKQMKWNDPKVIEELANTDLVLSPEDRLYGKKEIDPAKIVYQVERLFGSAIFPIPTTSR
jgi:sulfatase modifying factor 1